MPPATWGIRRVSEGERRVGPRDYWTGPGRSVRFVAAMSDGEDLCLRREEPARGRVCFGGSSSGAWACPGDRLKRLREVLTRT